MSESGPEAARRLTEAFGEPYREVVRNAVDAQQRNFQLAQGWVESVTGVLESQAEANRALTRAMESHTNAVEEAIKSQERTSRHSPRASRHTGMLSSVTPRSRRRARTSSRVSSVTLPRSSGRGCRVARKWPAA